MKSDIKVFVCVKEDASIKALYNEIGNITDFATYDELKKALSLCDYMNAHVVIVDIDYILDKELILYENIKKDLMYKGASLVVYGKNIAYQIKYKLYALDFKGVVDENSNNQMDVITHVMRRSNLYAATFENNFIKGMIEFFSMSDDSKNSTYLFDYLAYHYKISNNDAANMRLVFLSLLMAFKAGKVLQTVKMLNIIFKSSEVNTLYKSYTQPKSFNNKIIAILLMLNESASISNYLSDINMKNVEPELIDEIKGFEKSKIITISSYQDINFFWEQLNLVILKKYLKDDFGVLDSFLSAVYDITLQSLVYVNYLVAYIEFNESDDITVNLKYIGSKNLIIQKYIESTYENLENVDVALDKDDEYKVSIIFHKKYIDTKSISQKHTETQSIASEQNIDTLSTPVKPIVDTSNINSMHYTNERKISATDFLKEFEVDQALLDDLNENENEIKNLLYIEEELNQDILSSIANTLEKYVHVLHQTIEFDDLSFSLESLYNLFNSFSVESMDEEKRNTLKFYIQGLINDLGTWKRYIFIEPNTPDIHYLDASLLENCSEIERFIHSDSEGGGNKNNEDDLEFF